MYDDFKVKSLAKAMAVLDCFTIKTPELGITEIAIQLGLQKATVFNILSTLVSLGHVEQNPNNNKYHLGLKMLHYGYIVNSALDYRRVFEPYLQKISTMCNEVCYLGIPNNNEVLYLDSASPNFITPGRVITGEHAPMHCTGLGKAMLAFMPKETVSEVMCLPMQRYTECTITDPLTLHSDLMKTGSRGYAVDNMEHEYGVTCVAVPVIGMQGFPIAAVSISGPTPRFSQSRIPELAQILKDVLNPLQHSL